MHSNEKSLAAKKPEATTSIDSGKKEPGAAACPPASGIEAGPGRVPPLFRRIDWLTFLVTAAAVWLGYYLTLAPEVTLEDSGELATGSFYAGIPHAPGYPVWTVYTWLWTVLLPFKNVAWRVALGEATAGAVAAGLLGLLVSRGSSLLCQGIEELKGMPSRWENAICLVSGFVAGMLIGYNGFMWSQSVIVEVYSLGVLSFMLVLLFLLRWIYAPWQRRFLYYALFFFGVCFTNHQTLIVAAMGIEIGIAAADFRLGRSLFLGNSILYFMGWLLSSEHVLTALEANPAVLAIFHVVGACSVAAYALFAYLTRASLRELAMDFLYAVFWVLLAAIPTLGASAVVIALGAAAGFAYMAWRTWEAGHEWLIVLIAGFCWIAGAALYFYMPLACMTNPPMEWAYPRTIDGFIHAITRGQYGATRPTDIIHHPDIFALQLLSLGRGIVEEFNLVYAFLALVPFLFFRKLHRRERAWIIGITAIYLFLGILLLILLNPTPDRASQQLVRVFFTASHTLIALLVGYGLTLVAVFMASNYQRFRVWGLAGGVVAAVLAVMSFAEITQNIFFGDSRMGLGGLLSVIGQVFTNRNQYGLPVFAGLILVAMTLAFVGAVWFYRQRAPLAIVLGLFALMPLHSILTHWSDNEQRGHWFGYWYGHDMFTPPFQGADGKPMYSPMAKDAILFGGTDAGRFCPTYMIFCESFIPHQCQPPLDQKFDRRDVYIITQNALADPPYLNYLRAQYNRSLQVDPPFFQDMFRVLLRDKPSQTNLLARAVQPIDRFFTDLGARVEKRRRTSTSWLTDKDFVDLPAFAARLRPGPQQDPVSKYVYQHLGPATQQLLSSQGSEPALRNSLAQDLNRMMEQDFEARQPVRDKLAEQQQIDLAARQAQQTGDKVLADLITSEATRRRLAQLEKEIVEFSPRDSFFEPERFKQVAISDYLADFIKEKPQGQTRIRLNRLLLEAAYPRELAKSLSGLYPDREIYIPSVPDWQRSYQEYMADAGRRAQLNQLEPGEDVRVMPDGRVQINGQVSVMAINAILAKIIFDHCPKNEFYVEESMPLKWMYPYLTPYGIIMKVNRQPLAELSDDILKRDHEFWSRYSERLIGNWITYDTTLREIAAWAERIYQRRDYTGFKGDPRFVRDDQAQKTFSKLRTAIAGVYNYRMMQAKTPQEQQRMIRETEFALRQAFAFCPYNLETIARYVQLLANLHRFDDALLVARTGLKLDPYNDQVKGIVKSIETWKSQSQKTGPDFQALFDQAAAYMQAQQTNRAIEILDIVLKHPQLNSAAVQVLARVFAELRDNVRLQAAIQQMIRLAPDSPESWYNLAAFEVFSGNAPAAIDPLRRALELNAQRLKNDPKAHDIRVEIQRDPRFDPVLQRPEFRQLIGPAPK